MPYFYILRVVREDNPADRSEVQIKFYPVTGINDWLRLGVIEPGPVKIEAEDELEAWKLCKKRFPNHRTSLAIQEVTSYDRTVAGLVAKRLLRGNANSVNRAKTEGSMRDRDFARIAGIPALGPIGPDENQKAAELAF